jgi:hypothetical protein
MTLEEAKRIIAIKHNVDTFNLTVWMTDEAAELYARSKWDEACEAQRVLCNDEYMRIDVCDHSNKFETIDLEIQAIKNAPKPKFKP